MFKITVKNSNFEFQNSKKPLKVSTVNFKIEKTFEIVFLAFNPNKITLKQEKLIYSEQKRQKVTTFIETPTHPCYILCFKQESLSQLTIVSNKNLTINNLLGRNDGTM